ncbi:MAG: DegV family protein [Oscillospiraceae bacterium]|nr:DegV family protein [Oscillospiraceae bacterium]
MPKKIILSADSTCDLPRELAEKYDVLIQPGYVVLDGVTYGDGTDCFADDIFKFYNERKMLPKTTAINSEEYSEMLRARKELGDEVIHFTIGSGLSIGFQQCKMAAAELEGVYAIDSCHLSTGIAMLVIRAAELIALGMPAARIVEEIERLKPLVQTSFVIDTLEFLHKGGRCSALALLGANMLKLKPCIEVDPANGGAMTVGKKYRGALENVLKQYVEEKLSMPNIDYRRAFITYSTMKPERLQLVRDLVAANADFTQVTVCQAGASVCAHAGPETVGVIFALKE